ncbi:hypothetical protein IX38_16105 [Chryseobacterium luteum]|uniref:Uncharacterized protein n=1 Tax=Chryseobacterium luteum TaxID=421531 RepID=A0A085ZC51_9FLAO|nr:hypothetical protein IX38_16105 [Chryseobacterium luteum]
MALFCGLTGVFFNHTLQAFSVLAAITFILIWLIDTVIIVQKLGINLNTLYLTDKIMFNSLEIDPSRITKIKTENMYPDSIISKWKITAIRFTLDDNTDFYILGKPHSIFFYIKYIAGIFISYYAGWRKYKSGRQRSFTPLSGYFVKETSQTLHFLILKYPDLRLKVL